MFVGGNKMNILTMSNKDVKNNGIFEHISDININKYKYHHHRAQSVIERPHVSGSDYKTYLVNSNNRNNKYGY